MEHLEELNWQVAAVKGRTKAEIYRIMVMKGKFYLPPESQCNSDFIFDVMVFKQNEIELTHIPQIDGLRVHQILEMARQHAEIDLYIPDLKEDKLPNRDFVINVGKTISNIFKTTVNTLIPEQLQEMVEGALEVREQKYTKKKNIKMNVLPSFRAMFEETNEVSRRNGRFYQLVRNTEKRRQNKKEKVDPIIINEVIKKEIYLKDAAIRELNDKIDRFSKLEEENDKNSEILARLFDAGVINNEGNLIRPSENINEMESQ